MGDVDRDEIPEFIVTIKAVGQIRADGACFKPCQADDHTDALLNFFAVDLTAQQIRRNDLNTPRYVYRLGETKQVGTQEAMENFSE